MAKYEPDGDRVLWNEKYCNGQPCPVDCYRCPIAEKIYEEESEENPAD